MKVFITGGNGFVGSAIVRQLLARGDEVVALVRTVNRAKALMDTGVRPVAGDILHPSSYRRHIAGAEAVFHVAAWYQVGVYDRERMRRINVEGTRAVLETAVEAGVRKIVYTSTVGVFGNTAGKLVDETYRGDGKTFASEYERTKYLAHYEVAVPLQQQGAPVVIVQPGMVYGPGDTSQLGGQLKQYAKGKLRAFAGPRSALTWAHVDDVAAGHLLAADRGRAGESYILAGPAANFREFFQLCERGSGIPAPRLWLPDGVAVAAGRVLKLIDPRLPRKWRGNWELLASAGGLSYLARSDKAVRELGWQARSLEEGLPETIEWFRNLKEEPKPILFSVDESDGRVFGP